MPTGEPFSEDELRNMKGFHVSDAEEMRRTPLQAGDTDEALRRVARQLLNAYDEIMGLITSDQSMTEIITRGVELHAHQRELYEELRKLVA